MDKEEIKDYLKRVDKLLDKLKGEDKETLSWLIYGYNQCAKLLNEIQKENEKLKAELQLYQGALKREHEAIHRANDLEEVIKRAIEYIESKNNGHCIINGEEKGAFTFVLDFDEAREFIWELLDILKEVE